MSIVNGSNQAKVPAQEHQGPRDESHPLAPHTEQPTLDSQNMAQKLVSIGHQYTGPLKRKMTIKAKAALAHLAILADLTAQVGRTTVLSDELFDQADGDMLKAYEDLHELDGLSGAITTTMGIPAVASHQDVLQLHEELIKHYQERAVDERRAKLREALDTLKSMLHGHGRTITDFVPSPVNTTEENKTTSEDPETVIETQIMRFTYPISNSSDSFRASNLSGMLYDESQTENTMTALINAHTGALRAEMNRARQEVVEKDRLHQQETLELKEQIAHLNHQRLLENSLRNELNRAYEGQHQPMTATDIPRNASVSRSNLHNGSIPASSAIALVPVQTGQVNASVPEIIPLESNTKDISSTQLVTTIPTSTFNNILATISRLEQKLDQQMINANEKEEWDTEVARNSNHETNIPSRARKPLSKHPKPTQSVVSELVSSVPSDDEKSRFGPSGSEFDNDDEHRHTSHNKSFTTRNPTTTTVLPKLTTVLSLLPKFDGEGDWEEFITTFEADIMSRDDIRDAHKFAILKDHLIGSANCCVAKSKDHSAAIEATFENIKEVFSQNLTKDTLLQKLRELPFHQSDPKQMRQDLARIANIHMLLKEKGVSDSDDRLTKGVASKFPPLLREGAREILNSYNDLTTVRLILKRASADIRLLELDQELNGLRYVPLNELPTTALINYTTTSGKSSGGKNKYKPAYDATRVKTTFFDHVTKTSLPGYYAPGSGVNLKQISITFPFDNREPLNCAACSKEGHGPLRCKDSSSEFRSKVERKKLCPLCLSADHVIENCKNTNTCIYCGGMHHTGGCPLKEFYRDLANYPAGAKARQTLFREHTKTTQTK
ncbi:unnamed protein product [Caenorhabditis nigoni]